MSYTEIVYAIGDLSWDSFAALEAGENYVNIALIVVGIAFLAYWLKELVRIGSEDGKYYENN